jgi:plastocyanin
MSRRMLLVACATLVAAIAIPAIPAAAGGGCHEDPTTGEGDTVQMQKACFGPTTLRVDPGDVVTFVNRDPMTHNVSANGWGFYEPMNRGDAFTATFDASGIYPFACTYHPGMTGAIVVGDGTGAGNGDEVTIAAFRPSEASAIAPNPAAAQPAASSGSNLPGLLAGGAGGIVLGLGIGLFARRSRSTS